MQFPCTGCLEIVMKIYSYTAFILYWSFEPQLLSWRWFPYSVKLFSIFLFLFTHSHCYPSLYEMRCVCVCVSVRCVQACAHMRMCACVHVWAIWFFPLYACEADVKACAFSLPSLLCSAPARSEQGENKRGKRGGESAPTVDLAIVGGGTLFPLMLWTHG